MSCIQKVVSLESALAQGKAPSTPTNTVPPTSLVSRAQPLTAALSAAPLNSVPAVMI